MISHAEVEDILWREFRTNRNDVADDNMIGHPPAVHAALPMRPDKVMDYLGITAEELIDLVKTGELPRPANWGGNRVVWRRDEVAACGDRRRT